MRVEVEEWKVEGEKNQRQRVEKKMRKNLVQNRENERIKRIFERLIKNDSPS